MKLFNKMLLSVVLFTLLLTSIAFGSTTNCNHRYEVSGVEYSTSHLSHEYLKPDVPAYLWITTYQTVDKVTSTYKTRVPNPFAIGTCNYSKVSKLTDYLCWFCAAKYTSPQYESQYGHSCGSTF